MSDLVSVKFVCDGREEAHCEVQYLFMPLVRVSVDEGLEAIRYAKTRPALPRNTFAECMWATLDK